jgi:hypothetical protein
MNYYNLHESSFYIELYVGINLASILYIFIFT